MLTGIPISIPIRLISPVPYLILYFWTRMSSSFTTTKHTIEVFLEQDDWWR